MTSSCRTPLETQLYLTRSTLSTWPTFLQNSAEEIKRFTAERLALPLLPQIHRAWPALPASTLLRYELLKPFAGSSVLLRDDVDGLGFLLSQSAQVTCFVDDPERRDWQEHCAAQTQSANYTCVDSFAAQAKFDLLLTTLDVPTLDQVFLERAWASIKLDGYWAIQVRSPWDETLYQHLPAEDLEVVKYFREVNHSVLGDAHLLDGAGDLLVYRKKSEQPLSLEDFLPGRDKPFHYYNDLDTLDETTLNEQGIHTFLGLLADKLKRKSLFHHIVTTGEGFSFCFSEEEGFGLSGQVHVDEEHLLLSYMPYSPQLEYHTLVAAIEVFGGEATRVRSQRTHFFHDEKVFG